jgi:Holliday junction DNA helicase RuvA
MIASLNGRISRISKGYLVVSVGGFGLQVFVPRQLMDELRQGEQVQLFTHMVVRQDSLALYGFESVEACDIFELLLSVNGVGPRLALAMLSTLDPETIRRAVFNGQAEVFSRVPGVGKKTAQKILFNLQDKITSIEGLEPMPAISDVDAEVVGALIALGYSVVEAQAAIQAIPNDASQELEERLRLALQFFST